MMIIGSVIFVFGLAFLLRNLGLLSFSASFWSVFYPILIMVVGFVVLAITYEGKKFLRRLKELFFSKEDSHK